MSTPCQGLGECESEHENVIYHEGKLRFLVCRYRGVLIENYHVCLLDANKHPLARTFVHKMCFTCKSLSHLHDISLFHFTRYDFNLRKVEAQDVHYNTAKEELCRGFFIHAAP